MWKTNTSCVFLLFSGELLSQFLTWTFILLKECRKQIFLVFFLLFPRELILKFLTRTFILLEDMKNECFLWFQMRLLDFLVSLSKILISLQLCNIYSPIAYVKLYRLKNWQVPLHNPHLQIEHRNWQIPQHIFSSTSRSTVHTHLQVEYFKKPCNF